MSKSKAAGTDFETSLVNYAKDHSFVKARRNALAGANDIGDIELGNDIWTLEAKRRKAMSLGAWMEEARREAERAGRTHYAVVHKRWGMGDVGRQFVTMEYWQFLELAREL